MQSLTPENEALLAMMKDFQSRCLFHLNGTTVDFYGWVVKRANESYKRGDLEKAKVEINIAFAILTSAIDPWRPSIDKVAEWYIYEQLCIDRAVYCIKRIPRAIEIMMPEGEKSFRGKFKLNLKQVEEIATNLGLLPVDIDPFWRKY